MPQEMSDAEVFGSPTKELSDAEVFGAQKPAAPEERTLLPKIGGHTHAIPAALGLLEQPGAGLYATLTDSVAGAMSLYTAALKSMSTGEDYADAFSSDYKNAKDSMPEYVPITSEGAAITKTLSKALSAGIQAYGDTAYNLGRLPFSAGDFYQAQVQKQRIEEGKMKPLPGAPAVGAMGQAGATLAGLAAVPGGKEVKLKPTDRPIDPIEAFKKNYPQTDAAIEASKVGKIIPRLKALDKDQPLETATVKVMDAVEQALNDELGIDPANEAVVGKLPVSDKMKMVIAKYGGDKIPVNDQTRIANAYADKFKKLQDYQNGVIESRPKLPAPGQIPLMVTPKGVAMLSQHLEAIRAGRNPRINPQEGAVDLELLTPGLKQLKESLGKVEGVAKDASGAGIVLFRGQMYTPPDKAPVPGGGYGAAFVADNPHVASSFTSYAHPDSVLNSSKLAPSKVYPFVLRHDVEIVDATPQLRGENGDFSFSAFDEFARSLGPNQVAVIRHVLDEGAASEYIHSAATKTGKSIKEATFHDQYAYTDPSVVIPLYDFLANPKESVRMAKQDFDFTPPPQFSKATELPKPSIDDMSQWKAGSDPFGKTWHHPDGHSILSDLDDKGRAVAEEGYVLFDPHGDVLAQATDPETLMSYHKNTLSGKLKGYKPFKQGGATDIEGLEKNIPATVEGAKSAAAKSWVVSNPADAARRADAALENNYKAIDEKRRIFSTKTLKSIRRGVVSHDYDLQHDLEAAGPLGEQAMLKMNVEHNATMVAKTRYDRAVRNIFDDLNGEDTKTLEKIIRARRIVQIDAYKGLGKVRHEGGTNGPEMQAYLAQLEQKLGSKKFKQLDNKATAVFSEEKINLRRLLDNGLIDQTMYDKMKNLDYTRTEYLDIVDPEIPITSKIKGIRSIRSSGIPLLGRGKETAVNMDARTLLMEDIARVENRISRNDTLSAMYKLAEDNPGNGLVELSKSVNKEGEVKAVPEGWTSVGVRIEGKQKHIIMRNEYAEQFVSRPDAGLNTIVFNLGDSQVTLGTLLRTFSGASLLRATATTYNPFFPIAGLPMDILHLWVASARTYSPHLPMYLAQIGKDLAVTAKDAITHTGRWDQAMQEGMGPNFMTHEVRGAIFGREGVLKTMNPKLEKLRKILSYAGDTQDTWVRLAHRERLIQQGVDSKTATAMTIQRLNYYRGGVLSKFIDAVIPYTNITVNATSRAIENAAKDPVGSLTKVGWIVAAASAAKIASMITSPETDKAISSMDKVRNFNITFGDQYFVMDPDGNKRYVYVPVRLDQVVMPFNAAVVGGLEAAQYGKAPDGLTTNAIGQINPLSTMFPPVLNAIRAYSDNYDPFRDSLIYKGTKVKPEDQVRTYAKGAATSPLFVGVGKATGLSPMGLEAATKQLINTNNPWIQLMGGGLKFMFGGMDPREQSESTLQFLQGTGLSRIVKLTSPGEQQMKDIEKADQEVGSKKKREIDGLDTLLFQLTHSQGGVTNKSVENYINAQPPEDREMLAKHAKYSYSVDTILKHYKVSEGIPPRAWWISSAKISDEARAQVFYNEWVSATPEGRKRMIEIANQLHNAGVGYLSQSFQRAFAKERQILGDDNR